MNRCQRLTIGLALSSSLIVGSNAQNQIFVDDGSAGTLGDSWATAVPTIEIALSLVDPFAVTEIFVAEGVYRPAPPSTGNPRLRSFVIPANFEMVRIVGGFRGGVNGSILINSPDGSAAKTLFDGSPYTPPGGPLIGAAIHILEFPGPAPGMGQNNPGDSVSIENLVVTGGRADDNAGAFTSVGSVQGGAAVIRRGGDVTFRGVTFRDNYAGGWGAWQNQNIVGQGGALYIEQDNIQGTGNGVYWVSSGMRGVA